MILGQVADEAVVLARSGGALFAIGAECTHYHGPLADGMRSPSDRRSFSRPLRVRAHTRGARTRDFYRQTW